MANEIWVFVDHWRGAPSRITFEALALGRELANAAGSELTAVVTGSNCIAIAAGLGVADRVLLAEDAALAEPIPELHAAVIAGLTEPSPPRAILVPLTNLYLGIGTAIAEQLGAPFIDFCRDVHVEAGRFVAESVVYGGKIVATAASNREPALFGLSPGCRPAEAGRSTNPPARIDHVSPPVPPETGIRLHTWLEPEADQIDLGGQEVLVGIGRGMQGPENLALAEDLASALGGAVCGSRPVIDQGWLPLSRQVGKSGVTVKPKLYIAAGISGAPEHVEGMRDADLIVAVNTDPQAPIFQVAHFGVVADVLDVLPALAEAARTRKKEHVEHA